MLRHTQILGYWILDEPAARVAGSVCDDLDLAPPKSFVFLNPHSIVIAREEPAFRRAIVNSSGIFCDGVGLAIAGLILNRHRPVRVYGFEFFMALSRELSVRQRGRVFFLGGTPASMAELLERYRADFPGIAHVECYAPPFQSQFGASDIADMAERIAASRADVLWVGLGSPKQEKVLLDLMGASGVRCGAAIGAVFDFYTGRVPHAPAWIRHLGLQWAHRLILEPRRLWRRTVVSTPVFLWLVMRQLMRPA